MHRRFLVPMPRHLALKEEYHDLSDGSCFSAPEEFREETLRLAKRYWNIAPRFRAVPPRREGREYAVTIDRGGVSFRIAGREELLGAFKTLRQLAESRRGVVTSGQFIIPCGEIRDEPGLSFRGIHLCYFRETEDWQLEKLLRLAAYYKFNYAVIEFWGTFPFAKHPEFQWENKHGNREFLRHLIALSRELGITLIPQFNCFGHAAGSSISNGRHVVLDRFPQFAPLFEPDGWTWCLSNPHVREILREMLEEIFDLFGDVPYFHLGFDEAFNAGTCAQCAGADYHRLLLEHLLFLHGVLAEHRCRAIIWHDMFLELDREKWGDCVLLDRNTPNPHEILDRLPRDIVLAVWHYHHPEEPPLGELCWPTAAHFAAKGFPVLLCPCFDERGIITMAEQAADTGLPGMLQTTWVSYSGTSRMRQLFFVSANKMWNRAWQPERGFADEFGVVNTHLRQIVADMGLREYEQTGSIYTGYSFYP